MNGKQFVIEKLVKEMEKSTVATFPAIWEVFCKVIDDDNPKNFEKYIDKRINMDKQGFS